MVFLDTRKVEKVKSNFGLLPKGMYRVLLTGAEEKTSQAGGAYISITFDVIEGEHKGRKLWHNFTTKNSNPQAVAIGQSDLAKLIEACGHIGEVKDEQHFYKIVMDQVLWLDVGIRKDKKTGEEKNQIYDFLPEKAKAEEAPVGQLQDGTLDPNSIPF